MRSKQSLFKNIVQRSIHLLHCRRGDVALIFAISLIPILLASGGAVDFTRYYDAQQNIQTALDAATLAGSADNNSQTQANSVFTSWKVSIDGSVNPTTEDGTTTYLSCNKLPPSGVTADSGASYFTCTASATLNMYFTQLAGIKSLTFTRTATAERTVGSSSSDSGECIWSRSTSNIKGTLSAPKCQINQLAAGSTLDSSAAITTTKFCNVGTVGNLHTTVVDSSGNDVLEQNCTSYSSYTHTVPTVSDPVSTDCKDSSVYSKYQNLNGADSPDITSGHYCSSLDLNGGATNFYPGTYSSVTIKSGTIVFHPGLYIIDGTWQINGGSFSGSGVTFYLTKNASITFNSSSTFNISAPTADDCGTYNSVDTCNYKGILFFESDDSTGSSSFTIDDGNAFTWSGLIYLPHRYLNDNSSDSVTHSGDLVVNGMFVGSGTSWIQSGTGTTTTTSTYSAPRLIR